MPFFLLGHFVTLCVAFVALAPLGLSYPAALAVDARSHLMNLCPFRFVALLLPFGVGRPVPILRRIFVVRSFNKLCVFVPDDSTSIGRRLNKLIFDLKLGGRWLVSGGLLLLLLLLVLL